MRIAILKPSALGDVVHALPVLNALRRRHPTAHIAWVVNRAYAPLIAAHPALSEVVPFDRGAFGRNPLAALGTAWRFAETLRKKRFDLVVDLQGLLRTGLMAAATGAPKKVGFTDAREGATRFYTHRVAVPDADRIHAVERYWRVAEFLGAEGPKTFGVPVPPSELAVVRRQLSGLPRPWVAVAAGSRWVTKLWPAEHYAELLGSMQRRHGGSVLFVGTAGDIPVSDRIAAGLPGPHRNLCGGTSLPRLAAVLDSADVMVGNDTGPLHLAAALGVPCVAPYTCTKAAKHGPYGVSGGGVETRVPCGGSYLKKCPHGMACTAELTPARLSPTLDEVLNRWPARSRSA